MTPRTGTLIAETTSSTSFHLSGGSKTTGLTQQCSKVWKRGPQFCAKMNSNTSLIIKNSHSNSLVLQQPLIQLSCLSGDYEKTVAVLDELEQVGGYLGSYAKQVTLPVSWVENFRAGDAPALLYLLDPSNDIEDPAKGSWAGR